MPLPTTFNPSNANFQAFTNVGNRHMALAGLVAMAACTTVGVVALFTYAAAASGPILLSGVTYQTTINGVVHTGTVVYSSAGTGLTAGQIAGLASARMLALGSVAPATLNSMMQAFGFTRVGTVASLIALSLYDRILPTGYFNNFGVWMGSSPGGSTTPPGFPGFLGGPTRTVYPGNGVYACSEAAGILECRWYY